MNKIRNLVVWTAKKDSTFVPPKGAKVSYANPRLWKGNVRPIYDSVYAPDYPHIEEAFRKAGKQVYRPDNTPDPVPQSVEQVKEDDENPVDDIGDTWRNLPWPQLRSKATEFTDEPIKSKDQAIEVLEKAEFDGRM